MAKSSFFGSASHSMQLILVERIESAAPGTKPKPLWLVWVGNSVPSLELIWQQYLRRFAVDHWYRLLKQRLHWTLPQLSTPQQCERWSDLMPMLTWELWQEERFSSSASSPLAKTTLKFNPRTGRSVDIITFT